MEVKITGPRAWVYRCNDSEKAPWPARGDWRDVFAGPDDGTEWGGEWSTKNPESLKIIRERMKPGDYVLCYQTDRREMVGVCDLVRFVHTSRGPRKGRNLILRPAEEFQPTVKIHDLKHKIPALKMVRALQPGVKTLYEVTDQEAQILLSACGSRMSPLPQLLVPRRRGGDFKEAGLARPRRTGRSKIAQSGMLSSGTGSAGGRSYHGRRKKSGMILSAQRRHKKSMLKSKGLKGRAIPFLLQARNIAV